MLKDEIKEKKDSNQPRLTCQTLDSSYMTKIISWKVNRNKL
jgi:hypothetical protein